MFNTSFNIYKFNRKSDFLNCKPIVLSNTKIDSLFMDNNDFKLFIYLKGIETIKYYLITVKEEDFKCFHEYISKDITWIDVIPIKTVDELLLANRLIKLK